MAVILLGDSTKYVGLSTDTKPVGVMAGTIFYESNSQLTYICYDGTNYGVLNNPPKWTMQHSLEDM